MTINLVGTSSYELSNDGNHVIVNDDGLTKDCTAVTGRATDTLGWIVMGAPDVEQGRDWTLHLDNPFTTNVGVTGDSSRLVHIELDDGKHSVDSLTLDASHTAVAQHWDARAFGPNQVLMDDLDTDGDADVATPGLFLVHTALRTGSGGDTIRDAGGGATYAGDGADTYTGNGTVHPGLGDDDVTLNGVGRVSFDESNDGSDHARAVPFSNPGPGDNMVVSYRPRTGGLQLSLDGEANDGDPGNSAEHDNIEPGFTVVEGESGGVNHLVGSLRAEELRGGKLADTILGEGGNDRLLGGAGNDYLSGNSGNDTFVAAHFSDGADRMLGGFGSDTVSYGGRGNSVTASIDGRANDGESGEHDSIDAYVERILGGSGPDTLIGNNGPNFLSGGPLTDHLYGKGGDDTLHSTDDFVDYVYGGTGRDRGHVDHLDRTYSIENRY